MHKDTALRCARLVCQYCGLGREVVVDTNWAYHRDEFGCVVACVAEHIHLALAVEPTDGEYIVLRSQVRDELLRRRSAPGRGRGGFGEIARQMGVHRSFVSKIANNNPRPSPRTTLRVARALGLWP